MPLPPELLPLLENEGKTVYNSGALNALRAAQNAENAGQAALAAGNDAPLTQNPFASLLSGIDKSQLPQQTNASTGFQLVGSPQDRGFTLGPSSDISRPPVPYDPSVLPPDPSNLPVPSASGAGDVIDISPLASRWKQAAPYIAGAGALGAAGYMGMRGNDNPSAQAAPPSGTTSPPSPPKSDNADNIPDDEYNAMDDLLKPDGSSSAKSNSGSPNESSDESSPDQSPVSSPDSGTPDNLASVQKLMDMQQRAGQLQAILGGIRGVTDATYAGMGKANPFDRNFATMQAQASELPSNYAQDVDFQKQDPNSAISRTFRDLAKQSGMQVNPQTSAAQLEKPIQELGRIQEMKARIAELHDYHQKYLDMRNDVAAQRGSDNLNKAQEKYETGLDKTITSVGKTLDPSLQRQNTAYGKAAMNLQTIQRVKALMNGGMTADALNKLPDQSVFEINTVIASLAGNGAAPTEFSVQHMDKNSAVRNIAKFQQWVTNQPVGAQQGPQMMLAAHTLDRQEQVANDAIVNSQQRALSPIYKAYFDPRTSDEHKAAIQSMLVSNGMPIDTIERLQRQQQAAKSALDNPPPVASPQASPGTQAVPSSPSTVQSGNDLMQSALAEKARRKSQPSN